jgi:mannose/cellobiose epimerase-like protein (N-acyl-D-glucosamine 2-epimerase family)
VDIIAIVRDITERKWAQEALRKSYEELEMRVLERQREVLQWVAELHTYIRNNRDFIPNGERFRQGERISTAFVESTVTKW